MLSPDYLKQQKQLHKGAYGTSAGKNAFLVKNTGYTDILDYGCGKRMLERELGFPIANYDPAIDGLEKNNEPHDFVYCGDVLEHVEPEYLDDVLADIQRCMKKAGLLVISTVPAKKKLPDGRNAHLIVEDALWWGSKLSQYFRIDAEVVKPEEYKVWVSVIQS